MPRQLTQAAQAAKLIRRNLRAQGLDCTVRSSNFSMGCSVDVKMIDQPPEIAEMRGKAGTAHPGRTAAQRRVLEQIWCGNRSPTMAPSTRDAMLRAGLIVVAGYRPMGRGPEFATPMSVHIRLCAALAPECPDDA